MLYSLHNSYKICHGCLFAGPQIMQERPVKQSPQQPALEDARDCLQYLIILYGETQIDTLTQLLNLTTYAESRFSRTWVRRLRA